MGLRAGVICNKTLAKANFLGHIFTSWEWSFKKHNQTVLSSVGFQLQLSYLLFSAESPPHPPPPFAATRGQMVVAGISQALYHLLPVSVCSLSLQPFFHKWEGGRARDFFHAASHYVVFLRNGVPSPGLSRYHASPTEECTRKQATVQEQRAAFNPILEHDRTEFHSSIHLVENKSAPDHQALLWHQIPLQCHLCYYPGGTDSHGQFYGTHCSPCVEAWSPVLVVKCQERPAGILLIIRETEMAATLS